MICSFPSKERIVPPPSGETTADVESGVADAVGVSDGGEVGFAVGAHVAVGVGIAVTAPAVTVGPPGVAVAVPVAVGVPAGLVEAGVAVASFSS